MPGRETPSGDIEGMDTINAGDTAWVLGSAGLVLLMTPGLALFYLSLIHI